MTSPCTKPAKHSKLTGTGNNSDQLEEIEAGNPKTHVCLHAFMYMWAKDSYPAPEGWYFVPVPWPALQPLDG